jgi:hypothetical protein
MAKSAKSRHRWRTWSVLAFLLAMLAGPVEHGAAQAPAPAREAEQRDMRLVGHDDLQGRSAYQPVIHHQGSRWIAYVGHHGGLRSNPITGQSLSRLLKKAHLRECGAVDCRLNVRGRSS